MKIRGPFSFYGSKSRIAHLYPAPSENLIIEPFAGSGSYAWNHRRTPNGALRDVWLNELDSRTYAIWKFLTSPDASAIIEAFLPEDDTIRAGQRIDDILRIPYDECPGLHEICRSEANQGTQGSKGVRRQITQMGAKVWKVKRKMRIVVPEVARWHITNLDYQELPNQRATWFIDPPYAGEAGRAYRTNNINYEELGAWCLSREGDIIVCEGEGANWLPFQPLTSGRAGIRSRYQKSNAKELIYTASIGG